MSLSGHQLPHHGKSDEWLTPPEIIADLGPFDLDPCAAVDQPWRTADRQYTVCDDGLMRPWNGLVWCNPPFGAKAAVWLDRLADHGSGLALVPARTETRWFVRSIWKRADGVLFLHGRPHFHRVDGSRAPFNSGAPICIAAYGCEAYLRLDRSSISGTLIPLSNITYGHHRTEGGECLP